MVAEVDADGPPFLSLCKRTDVECQGGVSAFVNKYTNGSLSASLIPNYLLRAAVRAFDSTLAFALLFSYIHFSWCHVFSFLLHLNPSTRIHWIWRFWHRNDHFTSFKRGKDIAAIKGEQHKPTSGMGAKRAERLKWCKDQGQKQSSKDSFSSKWHRFNTKMASIENEKAAKIRWNHQWVMIFD